MKRNYTLTVSSDARKALEAYRVRLAELDRAAEREKQAIEDEREAWSKYVAEANKARESGSYTRFAKQSGRLGELSKAHSAAVVDNKKNRLIVRALQESAHRAATAYIGQMIKANAALIDGTPTTYKCFKDFLCRVSEKLDRADGYVSRDGQWVQVYTDYTSDCRYIKIAGDSGIFSADDMPTMPDDTGAKPSAIYAAADSYEDVRKQAENARDDYRSKIAELKERVSALGDYALDDIENATRY